MKQPRDHVGGKQARIRRVGILQDDSLYEDLLDAQTALEEFRASLEGQPGDHPELVPYVDAVTKAVQAVRDGTAIWVFRSLGRKKYRALLGEHEARDEDHEEIQKVQVSRRALFNLDTFPRALVQACAASPVLSDADIEKMWDGDEWNADELDLLFSAAYEVNNARRQVEIG